MTLQPGLDDTRLGDESWAAIPPDQLGSLKQHEITRAGWGGFHVLAKGKKHVHGDPRAPKLLQHGTKRGNGHHRSDRGTGQRYRGQKKQNGQEQRRALVPKGSGTARTPDSHLKMISTSQIRIPSPLGRKNRKAFSPWGQMPSPLLFRKGPPVSHTPDSVPRGSPHGFPP